MSKKQQSAAPSAGRSKRRTAAAGAATHAADVDGAEGRVEALQQLLVEAQATIARDYTRLRELEGRYRHLFEGADALLVVDSGSQRIVEANPAAAELLGANTGQLVGAPLGQAVDPASAQGLQALAVAALRGPTAEPLRLPAVGTRPRLTVTATLFRQDGAVVVLLRLAAGDTRSARAERAERDDSREDLANYAVDAPDGVVLTDLSGRVLQANAAFVELVQLATERQVRGESLGRWLGRTSVDLGVLVTNLRQRGTLKLFSTSLRAEYGTVTEVEISAALVAVGQHSFLGFTIRDVGRRLPGDTAARDDLSRSVGQLAELVGRVPLKDIVGNTAGLIEKMCIEAALQLTRDNRAAAAELLGLSRQSLYVKLRRYGMGDLGSDDEADVA